MQMLIMLHLHISELAFSRFRKFELVFSLINPIQLPKSYFYIIHLIKKRLYYVIFMTIFLIHESPGCIQMTRRPEKQYNVVREVACFLV
jgi:hypothetical protein